MPTQDLTRFRLNGIDHFDDWQTTSPALNTHISTYNHHAQNAQAAFLGMVQQDQAELNQDANTFRFYEAKSVDATNSFGQPLVFLNRYQASRTMPALRPPSYNERLLVGGWCVPRFVWPNIEPFRSLALTDGLVAAVVAPGTARLVADRSRKLRRVLAGIHVARQNGAGIYNHSNPLLMLPSKLRFLLTDQKPRHWVLDLDGDGGVLVAPDVAANIEKPENRLFIPERHVALFVAVGWKLV